MKLCDMEHISEHIISKHNKYYVNKPFIVAIDGLSGAGKTTFVNQLKNKLDHVLIIHMDDHIVERKKR